jgi:membrane-bound serine protease (ClpP class)
VGTMVRAVLRSVAALLIALGSFPFGVARAQGSGDEAVLATTVEGPITPVIADHLAEGVERARIEGFQAYLVELDTPGGLDSSMRAIVQSFLGSPVPVIVHVAPQGARAASAGAFITMAADVAAMAPGTSIGAATPVDLQGGEISDKIVNDAVSYARTLAELRDRDETFAVDMVREGRAVPASEAVEIGVVDLLARDRDELLAALDGTTVTTGTGLDVTLQTADAEIIAQDIGLMRQILQFLADPNLAFLFMSLGTLAIIYELANPGIGAGAFVGAIFLLLGLFALAVLPVTAVGIALLVLAAALFVAELFAPGIGVFAAGGTISLALAGVFLFRGPIAVDPVVLLPTAITAGLVALVGGRMVWRARGLPQTTGAAGLVGERGVIRTAEGRTGQAFVAGALWTARADHALEEGMRIRVLDVDGLDLVVEPEAETNGRNHRTEEEAT